MLSFQYGVVDAFPDNLGIDRYAASSIDFHMLALFVSICVHSVCCSYRNVFSVKFPVCVLCEPYIWD